MNRSLRSSYRRRVGAGVLTTTMSFLWLLVPRVATAQTSGYAVGRFEPAERGSEQFVSDTLDLRGHMRPALGATLDYAFKPLVVFGLDGEERSALARHQLISHLGGSLVLADRVRLGLNLPVAVYQAGEATVINIDGDNALYRAADKAAVGDVRLAADVRLFGVHGDAFTLASGIRAWLPTGQRAQFTGDGGARIAPQLLAAGDVGTFTYGARVAFVYRGRDDAYAGTPLGSEISGAASFGLRTLEKKIVIGPEIFGSTVVTDRRTFLKTAGTPVEWLFGVHYATGDVRLGGGVGGGLTSGPGAPQLRALVSLEMNFPNERPDRDRDTVADEDDACPGDSGRRDPDPSKNGCPPSSPPPPDPNGSGVPDGEADGS